MILSMHLPATIDAQYCLTMLAPIKQRAWSCLALVTSEQIIVDIYRLKLVYDLCEVHLYFNAQNEYREYEVVMELQSRLLYQALKDRIKSPPDLQQWAIFLINDQTHEKTSIEHIILKEKTVFFKELIEI